MTRHLARFVLALLALLFGLAQYADIVERV